MTKDKHCMWELVGYIVGVGVWPRICIRRWDWWLGERLDSRVGVAIRRSWGEVRENSSESNRDCRVSTPTLNCHKRLAWRYDRDNLHDSKTRPPSDVSPTADESLWPGLHVDIRHVFLHGIVFKQYHFQEHHHEVTICGLFMATLQQHKLLLS